MVFIGQLSGYPVIGPLMRWQAHLGWLAWHWVEAHGAIAMAALLFTSGAGLPLPEDVPLIAAGVAIAKGKMAWSTAAPAAWAAMVAGDTLLYILGYVLGYRVVHLPMIGRHLKVENIQRSERWFDRWGIWVVGIGRMFAGIRSAIIIAAGTMRFNYPKLLVADGLAAVISGGAFMILGYWAEKHAERVWDFVDKYRPYFSIASVLIAAVLLGILYWRSRRRAAAARRNKAHEVAGPAKRV